jgi:exosortase
MNDTVKSENPPGFWPEAVECWQRLPNKAFFFTLLAAWLALFQFFGNSILGYVHSSSLFLWLDNSYHAGGQTSDDGHGMLIPFIVLGLFWWKRKELLAQPLRIWWPGLLLVGAGILMHLAGFVLQQPRASVLGMFTGIFGIMGLAWGWQLLKNSFFPFCLFVFCMPMAALLLPLTFPLRVLAAWLTATVSSLLTISVTRIGTQLISPDGSFQYDVAAACSGMRSLVAIFLLATIYAFVMFRSPGKRLFLIALALPLSVLGNFTRLMCIIIAAEIGGQSAGSYVHENSFFSLVPYLPAIGGILLAGRWMEKKSEAESK